MKTEHDIEILLTASKPKLDEDARARLWCRIASKLPYSQPVRSPYVFMLMRENRFMVPIALILAVLVGTGGLTAAAEASRPGDFLFPVERALENVRLKVARSESAREELLRGYGEERLNELRAIITEETKFVTTGDARPHFAASTTLRSLLIEAEVFSDTTVVKVELNDEKTTFATEARTRDGVAEAVLEKFTFLTKGQVESALTFDREDRASRPNDRGEVAFSNDGGVRVGGAITEVLTFLDETGKSDDHDVLFLKQLRDEVKGLNVQLDDDRIRERKEKSRFEWKMDDESDRDERIEVREGTSRVRIEEKNGEIRIDIKDEDESDDSDSVSTSHDDVYDDDSEDRDDEEGEVRGDTDDYSDDSSGKGGKSNGREDE